MCWFLGQILQSALLAGTMCLFSLTSLRFIIICAKIVSVVRAASTFVIVSEVSSRKTAENFNLNDSSVALKARDSWEILGVFVFIAANKVEFCSLSVVLKVSSACFLAGSTS